jgi:hypothetical protein
MNVLELLPNGWTVEQCVTCEMIFALPSLHELSGIKAKDILAEELERHVQQRHIDLPSSCEATE